MLFHSIDINFQETKRYLQWAHLKNPIIRLYSFKLLWYSIQVTIVKIHNLMHGRTQSNKLIVLIAKQAWIASSSNSLDLSHVQTRLKCINMPLAVGTILCTMEVFLSAYSMLLLIKLVC